MPGAPILAPDGQETEQFYAERLKPAKHHLLLIDALEAIERRELRRLMIFMPPGSAKTTYATICFPTWFLGRRPRRSLMSLTYGGDMAKRFGRKCRQIVRSPEYREIFQTRLTADVTAADEWSLTNESEYMAAGMNMGITGRRVDGAMMDDPIKGHEDATNDKVREKVYQTYLSDVRPRVKPGGFLVWTLTRWHEDDPVGRILPEDYSGESGWIEGRDGERWYVICLAAECERDDDPLGRQIGETLWPEWFTAGFFEQEKITQTPRNWAALYQQRPAPEEGAYFQRDWLRFYDKAPVMATMQIYGASDYAVTQDAGDYTVHGIFGVDPHDNIYLLDWWRRRVETDVWVEMMLSMIDRWRPIEWHEERGAIAKAAAPLINKRMMESGLYCARKSWPSAADKPTRAQAIRGRTAQGKVYFPRKEPWTEPLIAEILTFPYGRTDDQVDVLSLIGRSLARLARGKEEPPPPPAITTLKDVTMDHLWKDRERRV